MKNQINKSLSEPLIKKIELEVLAGGRFEPTKPVALAGGRFEPTKPAALAGGRFEPTKPAALAGGRFKPTKPVVVMVNDNSGCLNSGCLNMFKKNHLNSHAAINIPNQPPIVRRRSCFLYLLYLLVVMFATFFLYAVVCTILSILRVR